MGSYRGHALPGTFFLLFGLWHAVTIFRRYFRWRFDPSGRQPYKNYASVKCTRFPLEAIIKISGTTFHFLGEIFFGLRSHNPSMAHNYQHMTMLAFFCLNGIVDLLVHYQVPGLPYQIDYMSGVLAFGVEGILFAWHLMGRSSMDVQAHTFIIYVVVVIVLSIIWEMSQPYDVRPALLRTTFIIIQGFWMWTVGELLYPKLTEPMDPESHHTIMMVTMLFTWEIAAGVLVMFLLGALLYRSERRRSGGKAWQHLAEAGFAPWQAPGRRTLYSPLSQSDKCPALLSSDDDDGDVAGP